MQAAIQFVVAGALKPADQATLASLGQVVEVRVVGTQIKSVRITSVNVPATSAVPTGTIGLTKTGTLFTVDKAGGYLIRAEATDDSGFVITTEKAVLVAETSGRIIPPFSAKPVALNVAGQMEGWHPYMREWLKAFDLYAGGGVPPGRLVSTGNGLTGGGSLAVDRSHSVLAADGTIVVDGSGVKVGVITDANHGARAGGTLHAVATTSIAGFLSASDKTKLDAYASTPFVAGTPADANGTAGAVGASTFAARADHVHFHGAQTVGSLHAVATTGVAGFMSAADKTKLDAVKGRISTFKTEDTTTPATSPVSISSAVAFADVFFLSLGTLNVGDVIRTDVAATYAGSTGHLGRLQITNNAAANTGTVYSTLTLSAAIANANGVSMATHDEYVVASAGAYWVHYAAMKLTGGDASTSYGQRRLSASVSR